MTEFEKFWEVHGSLDQNKEFAEKIWHSAQTATIRTIMYPPVIPKKGDHIKYLSLCRTIGLVAEVTNIYSDALNVHQVEVIYERDGIIHSGGVLGEVEIV